MRATAVRVTTSAAAAAAALALLLAAGARAQAPGVPQGGAPCASDWDCSLAGTCNASAVCACDEWATGLSCALLNLAPAASLDQGLQVPGYHSWGGHALPDDDTGTYHGFFSFLCNRSTLGEWTTKSSIWRATAAAPEGPFTLAEMVSQPWAHNAMISREPVNGTYLLWQIGDSVTPPTKWAPCYEPPGEKEEAAAVVAPAAAAPPTAGAGDPVFAGQVYVRAAANLTGPWGPLMNVSVDFAGSWAVNGATGGNPAPLYLPNGTTLLYFTGKPCPPGIGALAPNCVGVARADSWRGPYTVLPGPLPIVTPESEDPFVFVDARGHYHLLTNVNTFHARCASGVPCGGHAWSRDGLTWSNLTIGAFGPVIRLANGTYWQNAYVERPQVLQAADGTPAVFYVGIGRTSYMDSASWAQRFCAPGDVGCGPTAPPPPARVQYVYNSSSGSGAGSGLCLATNASFPCTGGTSASCPVFLADCAGAGETGVWLEHALSGMLQSAAVPAACLNVDCNSCTPGRLVKTFACHGFTPVALGGAGAGTLAVGSCPGVCVNGGQGAAVPPCAGGEPYLPAQLKLAGCADPGAAGVWSRVVVG